MRSSLIYPGENVINDQSAIEIPRGESTGYQGMFSSSTSDGYGLTQPFPPELLIPENEVADRVKEMEERKSRLSDLIVQANLPPKDQGNTNYCWINGPTACLEVNRLVMGQPLTLLSPASGGGPITRFRNRGGWGEEALDWIAKNGLCPVQNWPANAINKKYYTQQNKQIALKYRFKEWWRLQPKSMIELWSCLLRRIPVAVGYNWWSHLVMAVDVVIIDGRIAIRIRNSWGDRPDFPNGFGILQGNRMVPDDVGVAPRQAIAS